MAAQKSTVKKKKADRKQVMVRTLCIVIAGILILSTVAAALFSQF